MPIIKNMKTPFVSVIIPCYNDEKGIKDTLESISSQNYPDDRWEVIVVNNNSTDNTADVARSFQNVIPSLNVINETKQSSYAARNKGINNAKGEICAFIDADMIISNDWLQKGVDGLLTSNSDYSGCRINIFPRNQPPTMWEMYNIHTGFPIQKCIDIHGYAPTACLIVRRSLFDKVGIFDERLISGGDKEFGNRVRDADFKMFYNHYNIMNHPARSSMKSIYNKYFRIGKGDMDLILLFPNRYGNLKAYSILTIFLPPLDIKRFLNIPSMKLKDKFKILFVDYLRHFFYCSGIFIRYFQKKRY